MKTKHYFIAPCKFLDLVNESKTLEDEDNMKWVDNGWRLNMIKDYKLQNGADVVLSQYQKCRPLPRPPNSKILCFQKNLITVCIIVLCLM